MAHPFSSLADYSLGTADKASENELWVQIVMQMLIIVNITVAIHVPAYSSTLQSRNVIPAQVYVL